ncbi:hypothetical protein NLJ89_g8809 [Agrocybe chaxingu]|uniref:Uncharacterized protein n=1 Tax=Agrocybe chaxingu TaxID=84603 RepID=A0A9W8JRZ4_9AGAR|nr:hypothetical protein NLJ89_g8809 [Agrocybe chaxingu]
MSNQTQPRKPRKKSDLYERTPPPPLRRTGRTSKRRRRDDEPISFALAAAIAVSTPSDLENEAPAMSLLSVPDSESAAESPTSEINQDAQVNVSEGGSPPLLDSDSTVAAPDVRTLPTPPVVHHLDPATSTLHLGPQTIPEAPSSCRPPRNSCQIDPIILREANEVFARRDAARVTTAPPPGALAGVSQRSLCPETVFPRATVAPGLSGGDLASFSQALPPPAQDPPTAHEGFVLTPFHEVHPSTPTLTPTAEAQLRGHHDLSTVQQYLRQKYAHRIGIVQAACRSKIIGKVVKQYIMAKNVSESLEDAGVIKPSAPPVQVEDAIGGDIWVRHQDVVNAFEVNRSTLGTAMTLFRKIESANAWLLVQEEGGPYKGDENDKPVLKDVRAICNRHGFIYHGDISGLLAAYHRGTLDAAVMSVLPAKTSPFMSKKLEPFRHRHNLT